MELQTPLNRTQLEILQMFKTNLSDAELLELKRLFVRFLAQRSNRLAEAVWDEKGCTNEDMERLAKLAALLRLEEYLERSKAQNVKEVKCHVGEGYVQIEALSDTDVTIEVQEANMRSKLFAKAYDVEVEIVQRF